MVVAVFLLFCVCCAFVDYVLLVVCGCLLFVVVRCFLFLVSCFLFVFRGVCCLRVCCCFVVLWF